MTLTRTHTRTHVLINFADPYLRCDQCRQWVTGWHNDDRCGPGCDAGVFNVPCEHRAGVTSACPSWSPVDGCRCAEMPGGVQHDEPPGGIRRRRAQRAAHPADACRRYPGNDAA